MRGQTLRATVFTQVVRTLLLAACDGDGGQESEAGRRRAGAEMQRHGRHGYVGSPHPLPTSGPQSHKSSARCNKWCPVWVAPTVPRGRRPLRRRQRRRRERGEEAAPRLNSRATRANLAAPSTERAKSFLARQVGVTSAPALSLTPTWNAKDLAGMWHAR